jgi:cytochrome b pre-mRNA-processing protein 3
MIPRHLHGFAAQTQEIPVMLRWLRKRAETGRRAEELYGSVVAAARQPAFYGVAGVPDTPAGRFELVLLHLFLGLNSLRGADLDDIRQRTIEVFVDDMDDCMRELGIGDLTVPKKVKRAAAAFYERATIYRRDLAKAGPELSTSLGSYILTGASERRVDTDALARYVRAASSALSEQPFDHFIESGDASRILASSSAKTRIAAT